MFVAVLILILDPYRRPLMQRFANAFWGGPIGALLMGSARGVAGSTGTTRPAAVVAKAEPRGKAAAAPESPARVAASVPAPPVAGSSAVSNKRLGEIEARLSALEQRQR